MKTLTLIFAIALLLPIAACTGLIDHQFIYKIEPRVQPYIDRFFQEASKRERFLKKENLIVVVTDNTNDPLLYRAAGRTTIDPSGQRYIYLWSGAFDWFVQNGDLDAAERLVFHEMGHAFHREHVDYKSIMNPYCPSDVYLHNDSARTVYVNELMSKISE